MRSKVYCGITDLRVLQRSEPRAFSPPSDRRTDNSAVIDGWIHDWNVGDHLEVLLRLALQLKWTCGLHRREQCVSLDTDQLYLIPLTGLAHTQKRALQIFQQRMLYNGPHILTLLLSWTISPDAILLFLENVLSSLLSLMAAWLLSTSPGRYLFNSPSLYLLLLTAHRKHLTSGWIPF